MSWRFFICACLLVGYLLLSRGVPPLAVGAGITLAALVNLAKLRSGRRAPGGLP